MIFSYISRGCEQEMFLDVASVVVAAIAESRLFNSKFLSRIYTNSFGFILVFLVQIM